jgi:hypothetical protein
MKALLFLSACLSLWGQAGTTKASITVTLTPISLVTTKAPIGNERSFGVWIVTACSEDLQPADELQRQRITAGAADMVHILPNSLAADVAARAAAADPRSVFGNVLDEALGLSGSGTALGGAIAGSANATYIGVGLGAVQVIGRIFRKASPAPDASRYLAALLPDTVHLDAGRCSPEYYLFASLVHNAKTVHLTLLLPAKE